MKNKGKNRELFSKAKRTLVGGVNSPVRAISPYPFFVEKGEGPRLYDEEGRSYIDYCLAFGPLVLGHDHPAVRRAVEERISRGWCFGTPTREETEYAELVTRHVPNVDKIRCVNTGTEATMTAIRLARGYTGRNKIIKVEGAFHGAHESVLVKAGSGALTHSVPNSRGIPEDFTENTLLIPFNDLNALERTLSANEGEVAAMITEPVIGNAGCILPDDGYLRRAKKILSEHGVLLIMDEVITGFRLGLEGAQGYYGVDADIVTMGKIVGGGFPIGVLGADEEIMDMITPEGPVYNAGTFNGHPVSIAAGLATLKTVIGEDVVGRTSESGERMRKGLSEIIDDLGLDYRVQGIASMFQLYFREGPVRDSKAAKASDTDGFLEYCGKLREAGVFLPPSQFECCFISSAHGTEEIDLTLERAEGCLREVRDGV